MIQRKGRRLGFALGAAAVAGAFALLASSVFAQEPTVHIDSGTAAPGEEVSLDLWASDIGPPGLGAWSIDITYDPDVVTPTNCDTEHGAVCNPAFDDNTVRVAGAAAIGFEGDVDLATITFECGDEEGESAITVALPDFADATLGDPQQINPDVVHGTINCTTTPPTAVPQVPTTGTGGATTDGGASSTLLIVLLASAGLTALAGYSALKVRFSRS